MCTMILALPLWWEYKLTSPNFTPESTKMATTTLAQDDFNSLALCSESDGFKLDACSLCSSPTDRKACDFDANKEETYVPVNFIPESVHALLKAWELSELTKRKDVTYFSVCTSRTTSSPDVSGSVDYEPMRCMAKVVPPKKFYRTFWRSIVRRLLEQDKETIIEIQRASTL